MPNLQGHVFESGVPREPVTLTLYRLEGCPYCERVVDRLDELDLAYESVWVEGMHSRRNEVKRVSGQRAVPVLIDETNGVTMAESERILEYLETSYATSAGSASDAATKSA